DKWDAYKAMFNPKREPSAEEAQRVIEFLRLINKADDETFRKDIASYLDVDEFLRFTAVTALLANLDNIFMGHNALIYLNPTTKRFVFIPWDLDLSFGGFFVFGSPEQQAELSIMHPYGGENKLVDRLLAQKDISARYRKLVAELADTCFKNE